MEALKQIPGDDELIVDLLDDMLYSANLICSIGEKINGGKNQVSLVQNGRLYTPGEAAEIVGGLMMGRVDQVQAARIMREPWATMRDRIRKLEESEPQP